jgi:LysR family transcriptional regulator, regulator for bpeEF and oprC
MDQLLCMRVFVKVVEHGSFARAAEVLDIPRPTATVAVARLEQRLGVRLLHRTTRRLSLTDDGRVYYDGCVRVLDDLSEIEDSVSTARSSPRGRLRVTAPNSFIRQDAFAALPRFLQRHPALELELVLTDRQVNLVEEGIDCAVRGAAIPNDSTLVARHVSDVHWLTCASPRYLKAHGTPRSVGDLERHHCIRFVSPSTGRGVDWCFEHDGERIAWTPRGGFSVTSLEGAVAAAAVGIGIAHVSDVLAIAELRNGTLQPLLVDWAAQGPPLTVVYPGIRYLTAKVRAFSDFVADAFPPRGSWPEIKAIAAARPKKR